MLAAFSFGFAFIASYGATHQNTGVLIVADEFPAMRYLAEQIKSKLQLPCNVVEQDRMPSELTDYQTVMVYIHRRLLPSAEDAFIRYTTAGGKLLVLHHSISSGKRQNRYWFDFLGVQLPDKPFEEGGYKWIEPVTQQIVCLPPPHFITTNQIQWPEQVRYGPTDHIPAPTLLPAFTLEKSEVYLNHRWTRPRRPLLGFRYFDSKTKTVFMQDRAGWLMSSGSGWIIYLQPGHSQHEFEHPIVQQMVMNAILWPPESPAPKENPSDTR